MPARSSPAKWCASIYGSPTGKAPPTCSKYTSTGCAASCSAPGRIRSSKPFGGAAMSFERLRALVRTLRFRLLAWNTLVVLLMVLPTLFLVRQFFRTTLYDEFDQLLREDMHEIQLTLQKRAVKLDRAYDDLKIKAESHARRGWFVQIIDADGKELWRTTDTPALDVPGPSLDRPVFLETATTRFLQQRFTLADGPVLGARVGSSLVDLQDDLSLVTRMVVITGGLILVLAP